MEITIEEFSSIVDKSNLKRTTSSSTDSFIQECSKVFSVFDFDGAGTITIFKLDRVMRNFGWSPTYEEVKVRVT